MGYPIDLDRRPTEVTVPIDRDEFRLTMSRFAAGVNVVTVRLGDEIHGMTATAVCGVSLTPPLLLVCVIKCARTHTLIAKSGIFAVNLLRQGQRELADRFAGRCPDIADRFHGVAYRPQITGAPILDDSLGYYDCRVVATHDGGDHTIFVGQVEAAGRRGIGHPLIYHEGNYLDFSAFGLAGGPVNESIE
jgi:flavin reductase (DIM6/NTAB) family NADH-FMN oxidoreductase RutF